MSEPQRESWLTFAWWGKRRMPFVLPGFLILSLFAHVLAFGLFQIAYPQKVSIPPTAPRVSLLTPSSPENISLLHWIESEDPALVAATVRAEPTGLASVEYHPYFATIHTPARIVVPAVQTTPFPGGRDSLDIIASIAPSPATPSTPPVRTQTRVILSGEIAKRPLRHPPEFSACGSAPLDSAQFLIGVTDRGEVRYTFLQRSSGDPQADDSAAALLAKGSFEPADSRIEWGIATIEWGDDAYAQGTPRAPSSPQTGGAK